LLTHIHLDRTGFASAWYWSLYGIYLP
jgi:hypothetical protein